MGVAYNWPMANPRLLVGTEQGLYEIPVSSVKSLAGTKPLAFEGMEIDPVGRDPADPSILYAGAGKEGLWQSTDSGRSWSKAWEPPAGSTLYTFLTHPSRSGVLYAGLEPAAVWKSKDGGRSWSELTALQTVPDRAAWRFFSPRQPHVRALALWIGDPEVLYVGIEEGGVYVSEDRCRTFDSRNEGLYRDIHQIRPFPKDRNLLFATTGDGLYRSEDAGCHWTEIRQGLTRSYTVPLMIEQIGSPTTEPTMFVAAAARVPTGSLGNAWARYMHSWSIPSFRKRCLMTRLDIARMSP